MRPRTLALLGGLVSAATVLWVRPWRTRVAPSTLLDEYLPRYDFRDTIALDLPAAPGAVLAALRSVTLRDMPLAWRLGELRYLPQRFRGTSRGGDPDQPFLALLREQMAGTVLAERPDEIAIGIVGRLDDLVDQRPQRLNGAHAFAAFSEAGFDKLAVSIHAIELADGRSRVIVEHRTRTIGLAGRLRFGLYWMAIKPAGALVTYQLLRAVRQVAAKMAEEPASPLSPAAGTDEIVKEMAAAVS